jgi:hypothetical protein
VKRQGDWITDAAEPLHPDRLQEGARRLELWLASLVRDDLRAASGTDEIVDGFVALQARQHQQADLVGESVFLDAGRHPMRQVIKHGLTVVIGADKCVALLRCI